MTDETPEVRELTLTKLDGHEARLTLTDDKLVIETSDDSALPAWLRGEVPFDDLDIAYVDPAKERPEAAEPEEEEEPEDAAPEEEEPIGPGFRIARWTDLTHEDTGETFARRATFVVDEGHMDLQQAEAFAVTFCKLAGRPLPGEKKEAEAEALAEAAPVEELPTGAPEPAEPVAAEAPPEEAPAFAGSDAFAAPDQDDDAPAFAGSDAFAAPDDEDA